MIFEHEFTGRKPSNAQVLKQINLAMKDKNNTLIEISWGENMITLQYVSYLKQWQGYGWIRNISGYDIAYSINKALNKFVADHFNFVHIGA